MFRSFRSVVAIPLLITSSLASARAVGASASVDERARCACLAPTGNSCGGEHPASREVLGFSIARDGARTFTRLIRNVTGDDDVYVFIENADPKNYAYEVSTSESDSPLAVSALGGPFDAASVTALIGTLNGSSKVAQAAAEAASEARSKGTVAEAVKPDSGVERAKRLKVDVDGIVSDLQNLSGRVQATGVDRVGTLVQALADLPTVARRVQKAIGETESLEREALTLAASDEREDLRIQLDRLARSLYEIRGDSDKLAEALRKAIEDGANPKSTLACIALGRFDPGKRVTVKVTVKEVAPSSADRERLAKAATEAKDILVKALEKARNAPEDAVSTSGAKPEKASAGPGETPKPVKRELDAFTFDVLRSIRAQMGFAFPISSLRSPDYDLRSPISSSAEGAAADGNQSDEKKPTPLIPVEQGDTRYQIRPTLMLALHLVDRYPTVEAESDQDDPAVMRRLARPWPPFVALGIGLRDIGADYFFGLGVNLGRDAQIVAGVHSGRVTRLRDGLKANQEFVPPSDGFQITQATQTVRKMGLFVGLSVEPSLIAKVFGGGGK